MEREIATMKCAMCGAAIPSHQEGFDLVPDQPIVRDGASYVCSQACAACARVRRKERASR